MCGLNSSHVPLVVLEARHHFVQRVSSAEVLKCWHHPSSPQHRAAPMPKRKAVQDPNLDDSDLSPPPNDLQEGATALANANAELKTEALPTKRRKTANSIVKSETTINGTVAPTQKRATRTRKVKSVLEEEEAASSSEDAPKPAPKKRQSKAKVVKEEEAEEEDVVTKPLPKGRAHKKPEVNRAEAEQEEEEDEIVKPSPKGRARKKPEVKEEAKEEDNDGKATEKPVKKKRKTKEEKETEAMPLAARTVGHKLFIGAHVSGQSQLYSTHMHSPLSPSLNVLG
jgi:hypothetical protein